MSQVDVQWPSEDEDFDATAEGAQQGGVATDQQPAEAPEPAAPEFPADEAAPEEKPAFSNEALAAADSEPSPSVTEPAPVAAAAPKPPKPPKAPGSGPGMGRLIVEAVLLVAVIGLGLWAWTLHSDNADLKKQVASLNANPQVAVQKQTDALINSVSKLIQLPSGETPTIANVTDAAAAKQQSAFFANAENGDKVLMYVKAGEAILYRPSTNKIVLVAPLTFTNNSTGTTTPTTTTKK